jgi:hypothetical protein
MRAVPSEAAGFAAAMRWFRRGPIARELAALRAQATRLQTVEGLLCPSWLGAAVDHAARAGWSVEPVRDGLRFSAETAEPYTLRRAALWDDAQAAVACRELSLRLGVALSPRSDGGRPPRVTATR